MPIRWTMIREELDENDDDDIRQLKLVMTKQQAEIARLQAQLDSWKELEGKDIYQRYVDARAEIKRLKEEHP